MNGIFIIFTLLSALRRGVPASELWRVFQCLGQPLHPKGVFWLKLCQKAGLLNHHLRPTALTQAWLAWPLDAQILHLFNAWETAPRNRKERMLRKRLRLRLAQGKPLLLSDGKLFAGLEALGIIEKQLLTRFGKAIFGLAAFPSPIPIQPWYLNGENLIVHHNPDWRLLWELEFFLLPQAPFIYSLSQADLRRASQYGDPEKLIEVLQAGLGAPPPLEIRAKILNQPALQVSSGLVLEFSDPNELRKLRRSDVLRSHFECVLSPHHLFVKEKDGPRLLNLLERRGIYTFTFQAPDDGETLLLTEHSWPSNPFITQAANHKSRTHFSQTTLLEPLGENIPLLQFVQQAIRQQLVFEMFYHAPGSERPEIHRLTPLLIEERSEHTYVIAYSHTRKGQRTYRLDRMEVQGTVPY